MLTETIKGQMNSG